MQPRRQSPQDRPSLTTKWPNKAWRRLGPPKRDLRAKVSRNATPSRINHGSFKSRHRKWPRKAGSNLYVLPSRSHNPFSSGTNQQGRGSKAQKWSRKAMGSKLFVLPSNALNPSLVRFKESAFFVKWCGTGRTSKEIVERWVSSFPDLITVRQLQNDFLFIECVDATLKQSFTKGSPLFCQGSTFHYLDWKPGFDPAQHRFEKTPVWLSLVGLPSKYWCPEALLKIGDSLGFLAGIEADFFKGQNGDVANMYVEIDLSKGFYSELEIISELGRWKQKVSRFGKGVPGKCILRNQIVNNSSLATSIGFINLPLQ
ncbi:hypothetical protein SUGI_0689410 [Cryptomeria japonica]|nr:hypothetical protein SUGI_0689410 [Cryptomeria japonica]